MGERINQVSVTIEVNTNKNDYIEHLRQEDNETLEEFKNRVIEKLDLFTSVC